MGEIPLARFRLRCHPQTPCAAVHEVGLEMRVAQGRVLVVRWRVSGDMGRLRVPPDAVDPERLWEHTCLELFVAPVDGAGYVEHNFSPTGQAWRFEFSDYRQRVSSSHPTDVRVRVTGDAAASSLEAHVPIPAALGDAARISPTAVIEDHTGALSYWAVRHPNDRPDFHDRRGFALALTLAPSPAIVDVPDEEP